MGERPFKPNIAFLEKVERHQVYAWASYSTRKGGYYGFRGGEVTYERHRDAGYVNYAGGASLGKRGYVTLTTKGQEAIAKARGLS